MCAGFYFPNHPNTTYSCSVSCGSSRPFFAYLLIIATGRYALGNFTYQVPCSVSVSFLQPYVYTVALLYDGLCVSRSCRLWACMLSSIPLSNLINHVLLWRFLFLALAILCTTQYIPGTRYLMRTLFPPCPSRLLLSVPTLKEYENLHVRFEDCVGRRVMNVSGASLELAPRSGTSGDAFHINSTALSSLYLPQFLSVVPLRFAWKWNDAVFCLTDRIKIHMYI